MPIKVEITNLQDAKRVLRDIETGIREEMPSLFRSLGDVFVSDVKRRIISQNDGQWAPASKWLRAKKGTKAVLEGAEKYVKARVSKTQLAIVSTARGWSLDQHHTGFENALIGPKDKVEDGRVILKIKDGRPLNLYVEMRRKRDGTQVARSQTFAFKPKRAGRTPARQIWPNEDQTVKIGQPVFSRWLNQIVTKAGGSIVHG